MGSYCTHMRITCYKFLFFKNENKIIKQRLKLQLVSKEPISQKELFLIFTVNRLHKYMLKIPFPPLQKLYNHVNILKIRNYNNISILFYWLVSPTADSV
jgi:hypothetical protein